MSKKTIYLLRHCQYANPDKIMPGRLPVKLSETGLEQAEALKEYFSEKEIDVIFSSAVLRCAQTSEIISDNDITVVYDKNLLETHSAYQGFNLDDAGNHWNDFYQHTDELGGETTHDIYERISEFAFNLLSTPEDANIIVCSHGDPLYCLYLYFQGKGVTDNFDTFDEHPENYPPKGGFITVEVEDGKVKNISRVATLDD